MIKTLGIQTMMTWRLKMKQKGFSLIELMIVVSIIGVLASIAIPSYESYILRSNRSEGQSLALAILRSQETYSINNLTYTTNLTDLGLASPYIAPSGNYQFTLGQCGADDISECVEITAKALGRQTNDGDLTINSRGIRTGNW